MISHDATSLVSLFVRLVCNLRNLLFSLAQFTSRALGKAFVDLAEREDMERIPFAFATAPTSSIDGGPPSHSKWCADLFAASFRVCYQTVIQKRCTMNNSF